ncbi:MAG: Asp23/Gls24 family envelope stress response protein [Clostridiales Family XIII bacterium]|jgi:uncharacterized alkaline shock family protein YloU/adenylate kinase family enzyme|nr:Asp23/Gls24 family envelope stress response protein [Clostridiales Family XIII bacterium]
MKIYSLVGKSGTGKSFQANNLCRKLGIESIIDDGLFIERGRILAGVSAKRQETKIRAIKTALFKDEKRRDEVMKKIREVNPESVLILGTSDKMVNQIAERLELPRVSERVAIESLTTAKERATAHKQRHDMGKHIIPAPTFQIKKDFSGYFIHPFRMIKDIRDDLLDGLNSSAERSVVRPTFSYLGKYTISDKAIGDIILLATENVPDADSVPLIFIKNRKHGVIIEIGVVLRFGCRISNVSRRLQQLISEEVGRITSLNILSVNVEVRGLVWVE